MPSGLTQVDLGETLDLSLVLDPHAIARDIERKPGWLMAAPTRPGYLPLAALVSTRTLDEGDVYGGARTATGVGPSLTAPLSHSCERMWLEMPGARDKVPGRQARGGLSTKIAQTWVKGI